MYMYMALGVPIYLCRSMPCHRNGNTASGVALPIGCTLAFSIITTAHAGDRHPVVVVVRVCVPALAVALLGLCVTARFTLHAVAAVAVAVAAAAPGCPRVVALIRPLLTFVRSRHNQYTGREPRFACERALGSHWRRRWPCSRRASLLMIARGWLTSVCVWLSVS